MDTHSGDTPINRFFSFWVAILTFLAFGLVVLLFVAFESGLRSSSEDPDDQRRMELDSATRAAQQELISTWKRNDDGTFEVPVEFALGAMTDKFSQPSRSAVPVPGTKAADQAAAAAVEEAGAEEDAATPEEDAATPEEDTTPEEDAAEPEEDAAAPEEDAAEPEEDTAPDAEAGDGGATPGNQ